MKPLGRFREPVGVKGHSQGPTEVTVLWNSNLQAPKPKSASLTSGPPLPKNNGCVLNPSNRNSLGFSFAQGHFDMWAGRNGESNLLHFDERQLLYQQAKQSIFIFSEWG